MNSTDKLGLGSSKQYDAGYRQGVADTLAGKPYDVANEQVLPQTVDTAVDRFLCWKLPEDFNPDGGIEFFPSKRLTPDDLSWPVGTNLLTADQAKKMFLHCLAPAPAKVVGVPYGYCPTCGAPGNQMERSPDGYTYCPNGHKHKHAEFHKGHSCCGSTSNPCMCGLNAPKQK